MRLFAVLALVSFAFACQPLSGAGQRPPGTRQVRLTLPPSLASDLGAQSTGAQIVALRIDGEGVTLSHSPAIELSQSRQILAYLPVAESPVLLLQTPSASTGRLIARLLMDDGLGGQRSRLPPGLDDIDLGEPKLSRAQALRLLQIDAADNPLASSDLDGDGTSDLLDDDDDGDGEPDRSDADADNDGIDDALQAYEALTDTDQDGVADLFSSR